MLNDVVISPFGASAADMVDVARCADASGFDGVWTYDHMTGTMLGREHSHDVFTVLGAMAAATERVTVGPLVANMMNRHPVQLTVAMRSLHSLSAGRAILGLGSGASPSSVFGAEHRAIGTRLLPREARARMLIETIAVVRTLWSGSRTFSGEFFTVDDLDLGFRQSSDRLPIIIGASSEATVRLALDHADGVNINAVTKLADLLGPLRQHRGGGVDGARQGFDVSVLVDPDWDHPAGGTLPPGAEAMTTRRVFTVSSPFDLGSLARLGGRLGG